MSQPLDFSSGARKPAAPPPPQKGLRRPVRPSAGGGAGRKRALILLALLVLLVGGGYLAVVVFHVFGGDSKQGRVVVAAQYCQLAAQLDQVALSTGAASAPGVYDGSPDKIKATVNGMGAALPELRSVAPPPVRDDVRSLTDGLERAAAGQADAVKTSSFTDAVRRVIRYRATTCSTGSGAGEG